MGAVKESALAAVSTISEKLRLASFSLLRVCNSLFISSRPNAFVKSRSDYCFCADHSRYATSSQPSEYPQSCR
jgi:hypothetical protein